ncbi:MAG: CHAT domain-containing protein [Actinomycetota bacterium]|nr:CHAT domain-containing protein [Actinomycetota bacterium]
MDTYVYDDYRVTFTPRTDGSFDMHSVDAAGATAAGVFTAPLDDDELERTVLRFARGRTTRRATVERSRIDGRAHRATSLDRPHPASRDVGDEPSAERDAERLGSALADALFAGAVGAGYERARQRAEEAGHGVRLTLSLAAAPPLLSVPWEFLYQRPRFLASQRRTPLVRLLDTGALAAPPTIDGQVRILGIVASPAELTPLDVDAERQRVERAVSGMVTAGRLCVDWLEPATPRRLRQALRDGSYHIVHFVGHSDFTGAGEGVIFLEDAEGGAAEVDETLFANLLSDQRQLRLVVLNSCEGARTTLTDPYAGVATTLIRLGVPAVVAMQFEISDQAAVLFAEELYTNLIGRQEAIDAAVAEARKAIYAEIDNVEWATPVLFVRDPDAELFRFAVTPADVPDRRVGVVSGADAAAEAEPVPAPSRRWDRLRRPAVLAAAGATVVAAAIIGVVVATGDDDVDGTTTTTAAAPVVATRAGFPSIRVGAEGTAVEVMQLLLGVEGFPVEVTGFFDDVTLDAVEAFEEQANIEPDGVVGRVTWQQLVSPVRRGDTGDAVLAAQRALVANGIELTPDGRFSLQTQDEVMAFQRTNGLAVDGLVDIDTWAALLAGAAES